MTGVDDESVEVRFAKKLASNDKRQRDRALAKVGAWLKLRSSAALGSSDHELTSLELLRLWKGLFFCMWMSDKPLVQEQLAEDISSLMHVLNGAHEHVQMFVEAGLTTLAREWNSLDSIRRDKFLMLTRRLWRAWLLSVSATNWSEAAIARLLHVCRSHVTCLSADDQKQNQQQLSFTPLGLQLHLIEIYPEELAKISGGRLSSALTIQLLAPFIELMQQCSDFRLVNGVVSHVFHYLMRQSDPGLSYQHPTNAQQNEDQMTDTDNDASDENMDCDEIGALDPRAGGVHVKVPQLQLNYGQLSSKLLEAGAQLETRQKNRNRLYRLAAQFNEVRDGEFPLRVRVADELDAINVSVCDENEVSGALAQSPSLRTEENGCGQSERFDDYPLDGVKSGDNQPVNGHSPLVTIEKESSDDVINQQQRQEPKQKRRQKRTKKDLARLLVSSRIIDVEPEEPSMLNPPVLQAVEPDVLDTPVPALDTDTSSGAKRKKRRSGASSNSSSLLSPDNNNNGNSGVFNGDVSVQQTALCTDKCAANGNSESGIIARATGKKKLARRRSCSAAVKQAAGDGCLAAGGAGDDGLSSGDGMDRAQNGAMAAVVMPHDGDVQTSAQNVTTKTTTIATALESDGGNKLSVAPKRSKTDSGNGVAKRARKAKRSVSERSTSPQQQQSVIENGEEEGCKSKRRSWISGDDWSLPGAGVWDDDSSSNSTGAGGLSNSTTPTLAAVAVTATGEVQSSSGRRAKRKQRGGGSTPSLVRLDTSSIVNGGGSSTDKLATPIEKVGTASKLSTPSSIKRSKASQMNSGTPSSVKFATPSTVKFATPPKVNGVTPTQQSRTPKTPKSSAKKVNINLSKNTSQAFHDHLITVRNSPHTPHNPDKVPSKGLLKSRPATPYSAGLLNPKSRRSGSTKKIRQTAADFF